MVTEEKTYELWVNWDTHVASLRPAPGLEAVTFYSKENYEKNLEILIQSGFRIL